MFSRGIGSTIRKLQLRLNLRVLLSALFLVVLVLIYRPAFADTIGTFHVSAQGFPADFDGFAPPIEGTLRINVTNGTVIDADFGCWHESCTIIGSSQPTDGGWFFSVENVFFYDDYPNPIIDRSIWLYFTTTNPGSLVGFNGGTIFDGQFRAPWDGYVLEDQIHGTITLESVAFQPVPEPGSMVLLGSGLLTVAASVRRRWLL